MTDEHPGPPPWTSEADALLVTTTRGLYRCWASDGHWVIQNVASKLTLVGPTASEDDTLDDVQAIVERLTR